MTEGGVENATLPVGERHQLWFVDSAPGVLRIGERRGQYGHPAARATEPRVELVPLMHPGRRETSHDWMRTVAHDYLERSAATMAAGATGCRIGHQFAVAYEPVRSGLLGPPTPAADADHLVEGRPSRKGVVGSVHRHEAAAVRDELLERRLQSRWPAFVRGVVIHHHHAVLAEVRRERRHL